MTDTRRTFSTVLTFLAGAAFAVAAMPTRQAAADSEKVLRLEWWTKNTPQADSRKAKLVGNDYVEVRDTRTVVQGETVASTQVTLFGEGGANDSYGCVVNFPTEVDPIHVTVSTMHFGKDHVESYGFDNLDPSKATYSYKPLAK